MDSRMLRKVSIFVTLIIFLPLLSHGALTDGLVAYYPFNGNANDTSGNGNHGTVYGATLTTDRFGNANSAYYFDGVNDYIESADSSSLDLSGRASFFAWIRINSLTGNSDNNIIINKDDLPNTSDYRPYEMGIHDQEAGIPQGNLAFYVGGVVGLPNHQSGWVNGGGPVLQQQWVFVGMTYDGSYVKTYINGSLQRSYSVTGQIYQNNLPLRIGARQFHNDGGAFFNGAIDEVRIYNRALSDAEIQQLFTSIQPIQTVPVSTTPHPDYTNTPNRPTCSNLIMLSGPTFDKTKKTIVLTHGWRNSFSGWPMEMYYAYQSASIDSTANIVAWDWASDANTGLTQLSLAESKTHKQGAGLGGLTDCLAARLDKNAVNQLHFIGHSLGARVNAAAIDALSLFGFDLQKTYIQVTVLDGAETGFVDANIYEKSFPSTPVVWIDNYISTFGALHPNAANVILTNWVEPYTGHSYPQDWYKKTIWDTTGRQWSQMGNWWSLEENSLDGTQPPPSGLSGTVFRQALSEWNLGTLSFSEAKNYLASTRLLYTAAISSVQYLSYASEGAENLRIEAYNASVDAAWNLATGMLILALNELSPSYAWVHIKIPSNALYMSFKYRFLDMSSGDHFTFGINDVLLFEKLGALVANDTQLSTDYFDVSQLAGQDVVLFFGLNSDGQAGGRINIDAIAFHSLLAGDFTTADCDVDGSDLATLIANPGLLDISTFAQNYGKKPCQ